MTVRSSMVQEIYPWVTTQGIKLLAERPRGGELTVEVKNLSGLSIGDP